MQVGQMVHQVWPGRGHQDTEAQQHAKGNQTVGDDDALAHSMAQWRSRTHPGSPPMHGRDGHDPVHPSQRRLARPSHPWCSAQ